MTSRINHVTVDCWDTYALAGFWAAVTGGRRHDDDQPGDPEALVLPPEGSGNPTLLFEHVPEGKQLKNRLHLDLQPTDGTRDEEVARLVRLGARVVADRRREDGSGWVVLADPEGNELCVERSAAERAAVPTERTA